MKKIKLIPILKEIVKEKETPEEFWIRYQKLKDKSRDWMKKIGI